MINRPRTYNEIAALKNSIMIRKYYDISEENFRQLYECLAESAQSRAHVNGSSLSLYFGNNPERNITLQVNPKSNATGANFSQSGSSFDFPASSYDGYSGSSGNNNNNNNNNNNS